MKGVMYRVAWDGVDVAEMCNTEKPQGASIDFEHYFLSRSRIFSDYGKALEYVKKIEETTPSRNYIILVDLDKAIESRGGRLL